MAVLERPHDAEQLSKEDRDVGVADMEIYDWRCATQAERLGVRPVQAEEERCRAFCTHRAPNASTRTAASDEANEERSLQHGEVGVPAPFSGMVDFREIIETAVEQNKSWG